jgi:serine/threonine-protein kinase PRP4
MLPLGFSLDMFSLGATLYELCTGRFLLPSRNNNHHLKLLMEMKGPFPRKMLQMCQFRGAHFDEDGNFLERFHDAASGKDLVRKVQIIKPTRNIAKEILSSYGSVVSTEDEKRMVTQMADLIEQCCFPDPRKRITPEAALKHPLFSAAPAAAAPPTTQAAGANGAASSQPAAGPSSLIPPAGVLHPPRRLMPTK